MTSKLFQQLAKLPGVNLFNWKQKTAHFQPAVPREEPMKEMTEGKLYFLGHKYFSKLIVQDKYISVLESLVSQYELEVEKMDVMQDRHEQEMDQLKGQCQDKIREAEAVIESSENGKLLKRIKNLETKNLELQAIANKNLLTDEKMSELLTLIEKVMTKIGSPNSKGNSGRVQDVCQRLTSLLNKFLKAEKSTAT